MFRTGKVQITPEDLIVLLFAMLEEFETNPEVDQGEFQTSFGVMFCTDVFGLNVSV